jgi:hypothetical protein
VEWLIYSFNLSVEHENVEKTLNVFDGEGSFCYFSLLQELEHALSVRVFRRTRGWIEDGLGLVRASLRETLGKIWCIFPG